MLFRDSDVKTAVREFLAELHEPCSFQHRGCDGYDFSILLCQLDHGFPEHRGVRGRCRGRGVENSGLGIVGCWAMVFDGSRFGNRPALSFLGDDVENRWSWIVP